MWAVGVFLSLKLVVLMVAATALFLGQPSYGLDFVSLFEWVVLAMEQVH